VQAVRAADRAIAARRFDRNKQTNLKGANAMKTPPNLLLPVAVWVTSLALAEERSWSDQHLIAAFSLGVSYPEDSKLSNFSAPVTSGDQMELSPGVTFDFAVGYQFKPWLAIGGDLGWTYNKVGAIGNAFWSGSYLEQACLMADVIFQPDWERLVPFAGVGIGGVYSTLDLGEGFLGGAHGEATDLVLAWQAFAGLRYRLSTHWSLGVTYRYLATDNQDWDVSWNYGSHTEIGVDSVQTHSVCLELTGHF